MIQISLHKIGRVISQTNYYYTLIAHTLVAVVMDIGNCFNQCSRISNLLISETPARSFSGNNKLVAIF